MTRARELKKTVATFNNAALAMERLRKKPKQRTSRKETQAKELQDTNKKTTRIACNHGPPSKVLLALFSEQCSEQKTTRTLVELALSSSKRRHKV